MTDNSQVVTGTGDFVRDIDRGSAKTQVVQLDVGGQYGEALVNPWNGIPTNDAPTAAAQSSDAPTFVAITGDPSGDFAGVNILEKLVDDSGDLRMAVRVVNPPGKFDALGAQIMSDAPAPINLTAAAGQFIYIDTTGYQSLQITSPGTGGTFNPIQGSNDGITWSSILGYALGLTSSTPAISVTPGNTAIFPVYTRYVRITVSFGGGGGTAYLRNVPAPNPAVIMPQNIAQIGGVSGVTGGTAGSLAIGGQTGVGNGLSTAQPVLIGGSDSGTPGASVSGIKGAPATRFVLLDNQGRLRLAEETPVTSFQQTPALNVQDTSQQEGASFLELLSLMLLEFRILNQQTYEMSALINGLQFAPASAGVQLGNLYLDDEPNNYRADPTVFIQ